jgi:hypothetical protein
MSLSSSCVYREESWIRAYQHELYLWRSLTTFLVLSGTKLGPSFFIRLFSCMLLGFYFSAVHVPVFSKSFASPITMQLSTALHMSYMVSRAIWHPYELELVIVLQALNIMTVKYLI